MNVASWRTHSCVPRPDSSGRLLCSREECRHGSLSIPGGTFILNKRGFCLLGDTETRRKANTKSRPEATEVAEVTEASRPQTTETLAEFTPERAPSRSRLCNCPRFGARLLSRAREQAGTGNFASPSAECSWGRRASVTSAAFVLSGFDFCLSPCLRASAVNPTLP
jgi:hypothetical protein